jgi:carboxylate-amine ligase
MGLSLPRLTVRHRRVGDPGASDTAVAPAPGLTLGVEEEFLLIDPLSGATVPCADRVLARRRVCRPLPDGAALHRELRPTQLEAVTGVCTTAAGLREHLVADRRTLAAAAALEGVAIVGTGTPVLASPLGARVRSASRFARIDELYGALASDYEASGCHVHVGVPDRDTAVAVVNHVGHWLPTLLALSVNSPFDRGHDTGYGSWRMMQQARFPGSGITPYFSSHTEYREEVARLVACGTLVDDAMTFWLARPSSRLPTVELRVADAAATVDGAVLQALLSRALVQTALCDLHRGKEAVPVSPQIGAAAVWSASRYGLGGPAVHPVDGRRLAATDLLTILLDHTRDALEETRDWPIVNGLVSDVCEHGTGADRQRRAAAGGAPAVLRMLTEQAVPA